MISVILTAIEVGLLGVFLLTAAEAGILRSMGFREATFRIDEFHHSYLGPPLVIVGWWTSPWVMFVGVVLTADDTYQHWRQTWCAEPEYRSPLHRLFGATLWRLRWVRDLSKWLDQRL